MMAISIFFFSSWMMSQFNNCGYLKESSNSLRKYPRFVHLFVFGVVVVVVVVLF